MEPRKRASYQRHGRLGSYPAAGHVVTLAALLFVSLMPTTLGATIYLTSSTSAQYTPWLGSECDSACGNPESPCSFSASSASATIINVTECFIELTDSFNDYAFQFGDVNSGILISNVTLRAPHGFSGSLSVIYQNSFTLRDFYAPALTATVTAPRFEMNGNASIYNSTLCRLELTGSNLAISNSQMTQIPPIPGGNDYLDFSITSTTNTLPIRLEMSNINAAPESPSHPAGLLWIGQLTTVIMKSVTVGHRTLLISAPLKDAQVEVTNSILNFSALIESSLHVSAINFTAVDTQLYVKNDNGSESHALISRDSDGSSYMSFALLLHRVSLMATLPDLSSQPIVFFASESTGQTNCTVEIKGSTLSNVHFGDLLIVNATLLDSIIINPDDLTFAIHSTMDGLCISNVTAGAGTYPNLPAVSSTVLYASTFAVPPVVNLLFNDSSSHLDFSACFRRTDIASLTLMFDITVVGELGVSRNISSKDLDADKQLHLASGSHLTLSSDSSLNSALIDSSAGRILFTPSLASSGSMNGDAFSKIQFADSGLGNLQINWPSLNPLLLPTSDQSYVLAPSYAGSLDTGYRQYNGWSIRIYTGTSSSRGTVPLLYSYIRQTCARSCSIPYDTSQCLNTNVCSCSNGWSGPNCDCSASLIPSATCALSGGPVYVINGSLTIEPSMSTSVPSGSTLIISGNLTVNGTLTLGEGAMVVAAGTMTANGNISVRSTLHEFRFSGRCAIYSTTSIQAASMTFSNANKVSLVVDASSLTTDGSCVHPTPSNALDSYFNTTFASQTITSMAPRASWDISLLTNRNPANPQKTSGLTFTHRILESQNLTGSSGISSSIVIIQTKSNACSNSATAPGLLSLVVNPCTVTSSLPWYAYAIPLIVIVILIIVVLVAIMVLKFGQDKILPWHQVIYNPFNPNRRVTLINLD